MAPKHPRRASNPLDPSQLDPRTRFLYTPHTVTALLLGRLSLRCAQASALHSCRPGPQTRASDHPTCR